MSDDSPLSAGPPKEGASYRAILGMIAILGGMAGLAGLFFVEIPRANKEPLMLALGIVLGWGSTVLTYEFGSSPSGRKAADAGIKKP